MASASDEYLGNSNRFLAVLRLDHFNENSVVDRQAIISGDLFSHAGDVLVFALLCDENIQNDISIF